MCNVRSVSWMNEGQRSVYLDWMRPDRQDRSSKRKQREKKVLFLVHYRTSSNCPLRFISLFLAIVKVLYYSFCSVQFHWSPLRQKGRLRWMNTKDASSLQASKPFEKYLTLLLISHLSLCLSISHWVFFRMHNWFSWNWHILCFGANSFCTIVSALSITSRTHLSVMIFHQFL